MFVLYFLILSSCLPSNKKNAQSPNSDPKTSQQLFVLPPPSYLSENIYGGRYIILSDGSVWMIKDQDIVITSGWLSAQEIYITQSDDPKYPYFLSTERTWGQVHAKKVSLQDIPH